MINYLYSHPNFTAGAISSLAIGALLHPIDKAIYLSVVHRRPFLHFKNFSAPLQGIGQTILYRGLSSCSYFTAQGIMHDRIHPLLLSEYGFSPLAARMITASLTGLCYASSLNWLTAIKYRTWSDKKSRSLYEQGRLMWKEGGVKPFTRAMPITIIRDQIFSITYENLRIPLRKSLEQHFDPELPLAFVANLVATVIADVLSAPFSFARSQQFHTHPSKEPHKAFTILHSVWNECHDSSLLSKLAHLRRRFLIGASTFRAASVMALGQACFDLFKSMLTETLPDKIQEE